MINKRGANVLSRAFCAVAVVATLSLWSVGHAADEAAEKTASEPGAAEAHQDGGGAGADGHDDGGHSGEHVGHNGVAEDVSAFSLSLATYTVIVFLGLFGLLY
ncbi:MAG TPA: hypothetical protein DCE39_11035, partial [Planctomycetaceae bacterium]|nr:hypothetical protein [Planctomycetaceae bacterium]